MNRRTADLTQEWQSQRREGKVMKYIWKQGLETIVVALSVVAAQAQTKVMIKANVPFDFTVGNNRLESGTYTVSQLATNVDAWYNENGRGLFMIKTIPSGKTLSPDTYKLVFHRYGDEYFLSQIWSEGESQEVPITQREKRLA